MLPIADMQYHPTSEKLREILNQKTQSENDLFYRVLIAFQFCVMASQMRCAIKTPDRGVIPVNMYALNLATSGAGKGHSTNILEEQVFHLFRNRFMETFDYIAESKLKSLADDRALRKGVPEEEELQRVIKEFQALGPLVYTFDSGTPAALKQMRHKLLMGDCGSMNLVIDEIGSNVLANKEVLTTLLELFDVGAIRPKITKVTAENARNEEIIGRTPTNLMMFGTPSKLLNGGKEEEELDSMLDTGYARRCLFGVTQGVKKNLELTPQQIYDLRTNTSTNKYLEDLADRLELLADMSNVRTQLVVQQGTSLELIEYQVACERKAAEMPEHEELRKAEMTHRYFKALKLAGAYAFVDGSPELTIQHLHYAIKLVEDSGAAFDVLLNRDRPYAKLAKYLAAVGKEVTQADLVQDLAYYRGGTGQRSEMLTLAIAYGYKNNIIIKKSFNDGIEFLRGEALKPTDLDRMYVAHSTDMTHGYVNEFAPWDKLHVLTQMQGRHWLNHHTLGGHRLESNSIPGFNMVVIDIDGTVNLSTAKLLLKGYMAMFYTTKSNDPTVNNRFRILLPLNYELKMDAADYKTFYNNVLAGLPFSADEQCAHRCKKWLSHNGHVEYIDGELFDALPFIPKTAKDEERRQRLDNQQQMDNLERWVLNNSGDGNRNNMLLKYAMILVDAGFAERAIGDKVIELNDKMPDKLPEMEIRSTILLSVARKIAKQP